MIFIKRDGLIAAVQLSLCLSSLSCGDTPPGPPLHQDTSLIKACIRATACDIQPYPTVSNCLSYYEDIIKRSDMNAVYFQIYTCVNRAVNCAAMRACFGAGPPCGKDYQARCDDGNAHTCDLLDDVSYTFDCAAVGLSCALDPQHSHAATCQGNASSGSTLSTKVNCGDGHCSESGQTCEVGDHYNRCEGPALQACLERNWVTFDCAKLGLAPCRQEALQWARCADPNPEP